MANRQTSTRRALQQNPARPWEAQEDAIKLVPDLPIIPKAPQVIPRAPSVNTRQRQAYVPPPPPVPDESVELPTSSLRFPEDVVLHEPTVPTQPVRRRALSTEPLKEMFAQRRYGPARYRLHIAEGQNSVGQQPLTLVARKEPVAPLLIGWVDLEQGEAQVRSYGVLVHRHERRHGEPPSLSEEEYDRFLDKLMDTLFDSGFQILHLISDEEELRPAGWKRRWLQRSFRSGLGAALLVVGAFALGLNVARLVPWLFQHVPAWIAQASSWAAQAASWTARLLSWL
jgi:hypothetical protein